MNANSQQTEPEASSAPATGSLLPVVEFRADDWRDLCTPASSYATELWDKTEELLAEAKRDIAAKRLSGNVVEEAFARGERTALMNVRHWIESHNDVADRRVGDNHETKKGN